MEKRDPLREVNTSTNNEPQDAVDDPAKQPDSVAGSSSDNKENGYAGKVQTSDTNKTDIGCGSIKAKETKPRRSILKSFDPLYSESPEKFQATSSKKSSQGPHQQFIIEEFRESESATEVSDDENNFVDACAITDEAASGIKVPENKNLQLEESLLKFYTPEKVVSERDSNRKSVSTSDVAENKSVLRNIESTSPSDQFHIEKDTEGSASPAPHITESDIVSAISKKLSSDYIIPTKSKFTISECELENYSILQERFSAEQRITADVETDSITSVSEIRNTSPLTSTVSLESGTRNDESTAEEHHKELGTLDVAEIVEKEESSDDSQESKITVIEQVFPIEDNLGEQEKNPDTTKEKPDFTISEIIPESSVEEPSVLKETESLSSPNSTVDNEIDVTYNLQEDPEKCQVTSEELPTPNSECIDKQTEKEETFEHNLVVPSDKDKNSSSEIKPDPENQVIELCKKELVNVLKEEKSEFLNQSHIECESKLEDKETENQDSFDKEPLETNEKSRESLESDREINFSSECQIPQESDCKTKPEVEILETSRKQLELDYETESEPNNTFLKSHCESESEFKEELVQHPKPLEFDCETASDEKFNNRVEETSECTELHITNKEGEQISPVIESLSIPEEVPEKKSEALEDNIAKTYKSSNANRQTGTESNDTTYVHQDEDHHLDSGVDSIEESFTKSPKGPAGDSEDSERGEREGQEISPDKEDSCLPEKEISSSIHEQKIVSVDETTSNEDTKVAVGDPAPDEQPQLLDELAKSKIEEKSNLVVEEPTEAETERTVVNLTDIQKSDITFADIGPLKAKMADLSEKLNEQQQENSDLKLQLNAIQQAKASLELEIRQKEEVIIKTQAEALKNEQTYKQEIKQLREKLKENSKLIEKDGSKELEDQLKEAKVREAKAVAELNQRTKDDLNYQKIMEEYENTIATRFADYQKLKEEHETATRHLANIELAFSDVHQKYERTKALLEGFKSNEEALNAALQASEKTCKQHEERYESLKAHAKGQIEKSNKEILMLRDKYELDINKLKAIIKRLEIKCSSLEVSLQQKTEECAALSALCDEVTGKKV